MKIKIHESIEIVADIERVFDYTQDYDNRLKWDTFLREARLINGAQEAGIGVKSFCKAYNGLGMETEYISFRRPKVTAIRMTKGPFIFKTFSGSWNFKQKSDSITHVSFRYSYELRFPWSMFVPLITPVLQKNVRQRLKDLKYNIELN